MFSYASARRCTLLFAATILEALSGCAGTPAPAPASAPAPTSAPATAMTPPMPPLAPPEAPAVPVREVIANPQAYLNDNFSLGNLNTDVAQAITNADPAPATFHKLVIQQHFVRTMNGSQWDFPANAVIEPLKNGLMQMFFDNSKDGFITQRTFQISYRGLFELRSQVLRLADQMHPKPIIEAVSLDHFDPVPQPSTAPVPFSVKLKLGMAGDQRQMDIQANCKTGTLHPARDVSPRLPGDAMPIQCISPDIAGNLDLETDYEFIRAYGVALQARSSDPYSSTVTTITAMDVH